MTKLERHARRQMIGVVSSAKSEKTITVEVERTFKHPKYGKFMRRRKRYLAHDEQKTAQPGDLVEIVATRPISKRKCWRLLRVVTRSELGGVEWVDTQAQALEEIGAKARSAEESAS
jgi:small subunit ribosomal protein S17